MHPTRPLLFFWLLITTSLAGLAQQPVPPVSALSSWQYVNIHRSPAALSIALSAADTVVLAFRSEQFVETFSDNRNNWPIGHSDNFSYDLVQGTYSIRRVSKRVGKSARAFITLPDSLNLNRASRFVIDVEMVVPKGVTPEGGLLLGVQDDANYNLFALQNQTDFILNRVSDGVAASSYIRGKYQPLAEAATPDAERNTLRVEKLEGKLLFSINGQPIPGDPIFFRKFKGNGIGFISSADAVLFRNLTVTVTTTPATP